MTFAIAARTSRGWALGASTYPMNVGHNVLSGTVHVGAALTMNYAPIEAGQRTLERLANGMSVRDAVKPEMKQSDSDRWHVGVIDATETAFETGDRWVRELDVITEPDAVVIGSLMRNKGVAEAMLSSWRSTAALSDRQRVQLALEAGRDAGGDLRGMNSASILVVGETVEVADVNCASGDPIEQLNAVDLVNLSQRTPRETRFDAALEAWAAFDSGDVPRALQAYERWDDETRSAYAGGIEYLEAAMALRLKWSDHTHYAQVVQQRHPEWLEFARRGGEFASDFRQAGVID